METNLADPSLADDVRDLDVPMMILTGEQDPSVYEQAKETAEVIPNATFAVLPGLGHLDAFARSDLALPNIPQFFQAALDTGASAG